MPRSRRTWLILAAASLAALAPSLWALGLRIVGYYRDNARELYVFSPLTAREFTYAGHPVSLTDTTDEAGNPAVRLRYGDQERFLPAPVDPYPEAVPGLLRHERWLRLLRFAARGRLSPEEFQRQIESGQIADRLVVVAMRPRSGPDVRTGHTWRRDLSFDFYELLPDGSIATERLHYPTNRPGREPKPGQLHPGTWQMDAAMLLLRPGEAPAQSFSNDAIEVLGWTLPVAAVSFLVLTLSLAFAAAPSRRTQWDEPGPAR